MQSRNKVFDDLSQLMTNAMGVAQGARAEAETAVKGMMDRWLADRDLVTRDEFDAVRAMAQKAREENEALKKAVAEMVLEDQKLKKKYGPIRRVRCQRMLSEHKLEVLRAVEASELPVLKVLDQLEIPRST